MLLKVSSEPGIERVVPDLSLLPAGWCQIDQVQIRTHRENERTENVVNFGIRPLKS